MVLFNAVEGTPEHPDLHAQGGAGGGRGGGLRGAHLAAHPPEGLPPLAPGGGAGTPAGLRPSRSRVGQVRPNRRVRRVRDRSRWRDRTISQRDVPGAHRGGHGGRHGRSKLGVAA